MRAETRSIQAGARAKIMGLRDRQSFVGAGQFSAAVGGKARIINPLSRMVTTDAASVAL